MNILDLVESLLLFWIHLAGMIIILGMLSLRTAGRSVLFCSSRRQLSSVENVSERTEDLKEVKLSVVHTKTTTPESLTYAEKENNAKNITNGQTCNSA